MNIFENAYFGKPYKMRNGNKAIFHRNANNRTWYLICEEIHDRIPCNIDGVCIGDNCFDIISEWDEEIDEKELDKLAEQSEQEQIHIAKQCEALGQCYGFDFKTGFKTGYHKALE